MQEFSDDGYNYLGEFLSENGYIVNSVDQNFLNGLNIFKGQITYKAVAADLGYDFISPDKCCLETSDK